MSAGPRIAFFGSSLVSAYWNGAATYYRGVLKHLHALGYRPTFFEPDAFDRQKHRDIEDPPWCAVEVYSGTDERDLWRAIERGSQADVLVKASGVGVWDDLLTTALPLAKRPGATCVYWDVDAPATLARLRCAPDDPLRRTLPAYDLVLTYGGGDPVVRGYRALGARACVPVYNALDPETHHRAPPDARFSCDLALLANRLPDREARVDAFFLAPAEALRDKTFLLGGNGWDDKVLPPNVRRFGHVYTRDHNALNSSAGAVLNVARDSMAATGWSPATRVFEAAGAGACIVTDAWDGVEDFLAPGAEILVARDGEEVARVLRGLSPLRARTIGEAARRRVLGAHTYAARARQLDLLLRAGRTPLSTTAVT
ncbi:MAG: glycosyltransferase [Myxococcales bacterium]|nr:glycosyltransferase [Myxococcales bacterium]